MTLTPYVPGSALADTYWFISLSQQPYKIDTMISSMVRRRELRRRGGKEPIGWGCPASQKYIIAGWTQAAWLQGPLLTIWLGQRSWRSTKRELTTGWKCLPAPPPQYHNVWMLPKHQGRAQTPASSSRKRPGRKLASSQPTSQNLGIRLSSIILPPEGPGEAKRAS